MEPDELCIAMGAIEWWATWASWLWTAAIALAFRSCFLSYQHSSSSVDVSPSSEATAKLICWGVPIILVGLTYVSGNSFGRESNGRATEHCGFLDPDPNAYWTAVSASILVSGVLWAVVLCNTGAFISTHMLLQRILDLADDGLLGTSGHRRRVKLWPTFMAYILAFCGSQGPGAVCDIFISMGVPLSDGLLEVMNTLAYCQGWLNAIVYGVSNKHIFAKWRTLACDCCRDHVMARFTTGVSDIRWSSSTT